MKEIALAILSVGLCFYNLYRWKIKGDIDVIAAAVSFIAALMILF